MNFKIHKGLALSFILMLNSCSYLFPKQFENFVAPEDLDQLDSQQNQENTNTTTKKPSSQQEADSQQKAQPKQESRQSSQVQRNQAPKLPESSIADLDLNHRTYIQIGLVEGQSSLKLNTPQPIIVNTPFKKQLDGNSKFVPCGSKVCLKKTFTKEKFGDSLLISPKYDFLEHGSHSYRGDFIVKNIKGKLVLINQLKIEDYLRGVLPHEIGILKEWAHEALKAQAVAARTYTYEHLDRRRNNGFDLYADVKDQMYLGLNKEYPLSNQAIEETRGLVMTHEGKFIQAFYHSTCGGQTADVSEVWESEPIPYLVSRSDLNEAGEAWCSSSSLYEWEYKFSEDYFSLQLRKNAQKASREINSRISKPHLRITQRASSGHISRALLKTSKGQYTLAGDKVRWLIKPPKSRFSILPSSHMKMDYEDGQWHIHGKGFGHGIGMCQMGARERSRAGQNYQEILRAYYTSIEFKKIP